MLKAFSPIHGAHKVWVCIYLQLVSCSPCWIMKNSIMYRCKYAGNDIDIHIGLCETVDWLEGKHKYDIWVHRHFRKNLKTLSHKFLWCESCFGICVDVFLDGDAWVWNWPISCSSLWALSYKYCDVTLSYDSWVQRSFLGHFSLKEGTVAASYPFSFLEKYYSCQVKPCSSLNLNTAV